MFCAQSDPWTKDEEEVSYMFMMFEFMFPQKEGAYFKATDSRESAGHVGKAYKE